MAYLATIRDPNTGTAPIVDQFNQLSVSNLKKLAGAEFGAAVDNSFWTLANTGAASAATIALNVATLTSGTANSGSGSLSSVRLARFIYGQPMRYRSVVRFQSIATAANGPVARWGPHTETGAPLSPTEGYFFSYDSATAVLSINAAKVGVVTSVASGAFNGLVTAYTVDTLPHFYEVRYSELRCHFFVDNVLIHTIVPTTTPSISTTALPIYTIMQNPAGGTTSRVVEIWGAGIMRSGSADSVPTSRRINTLSTTVLKLGPGDLNALIIGNPGTATNVITFFDNTAASGTVLGLFTNFASATGPMVLPLNLPFQIGLTVLVATGTASDFIVEFD